MTSPFSFIRQRPLVSLAAFAAVCALVAALVYAGSDDKASRKADSSSKGAPKTVHGINAEVKVPLPDFTGQQVDVARKALTQRGLTVTEKVAPESKIPLPPGTVASQKPIAGTEVVAGDSVTLYVTGESSHPAFPAPALIGLRAAEAQKILDNLKLKSKQTVKKSAQPKGTVLSQSPMPGKLITTGSTIQLTVSSGAGAIQVPKLVGTQTKAAKATLAQLGLMVTIVEQPVPAGSPQAGRVMMQSPPPGAMAKAGSTVSLTVGVVPRGGGSQTGMVPVPDVIGDTLASAKSALTARGFKVHVDYSKRSPSSAKPGHVIYQMPGAGNTLHKGDTVAIIIYRP